MTFELLLYIILILIASSAIFVNKINIIKFLYIPLFVVFILIIRNSGFDTDIEAYSNYMQHFSIYMVKEIAFYGMITQLYQLVENETLVFIIVDILFLLFLILNVKTIKNYDKRASVIFIPLLTLSFPFIMGIENIYRQFLGTIILLLSYSIRKKSEIKSNLLFFLSIFFHNSLILFLPLLILVKCFNFSFKNRLLIATTVLIILIVLLTSILQGIIAGGKSNVSTGLNLSYFYYALFLSASIFFIMKFQYKLNIYISKFPSIYYSLFVLFPLVFLTNNGSSAAERIGMSVIMIFILELYMYSLTIQSKMKANSFRLLVLLTFSMPTVIFSSSRNFLLTVLN